jgi:hypothetical protein
MISLRGGVPMLFGGSEDPTAYGELISIGGLGPEINEQLSAALAEILQMKLLVPPARFYIKFYDVKVTSHVYIWANFFGVEFVLAILHSEWWFMLVHLVWIVVVGRIIHVLRINCACMYFTTKAFQALWNTAVLERSHPSNCTHGK